MTYLQLQPEQVTENIWRHLLESFDDINKHGVTSDELEQARNKVASG